MQSGNSEALFEKKAFEISYAIFRLSGSLAHRHFSDHLESQALNLLEETVRGNFTVAAKTLALLDYFVRLAGDLNVVNPSNCRILLREIGSLKSAIGNSANEKLPDIDFLEFFQNQEKDKRALRKNVSGEGEKAMSSSGIDENGHEFPEMSDGEVGTHEFEDRIEGDRDDEANSAMKVAIRQSAILEKIRQFGNCQLKDLEGYFPDVSQRTLRYDLQGLAEQGLIERVGGGGPGTAYRLKEIVPVAE